MLARASGQDKLTIAKSKEYTKKRKKKKEKKKGKNIAMKALKRPLVGH